MHDQGGLAIAPHPFGLFINSLGNSIFSLDLDGIESLNAFGIFGNKKAQAAVPKLNLPALGDSDAHFLSMIGHARTIIKTYSDDIDGIIRAIKNGHTQPVGSNLNLFTFVGSSVKNLRTCLLKRNKP